MASQRLEGAASDESAGTGQIDGPPAGGAIGPVPWTLAQTLLGTAIMLVPWILVQLSSKLAQAGGSPVKHLAPGADALGGIVAFVASSFVECAFLLVPAYYVLSRREPGEPGWSVRRGVRALGVRRVDWRPAAGVVALGLGVIVGVNLIYNGLISLLHLHMQTNSDSLLQYAHSAPLTLLGYLAAAVLVAPICEEIFFRGFLFGGLTTSLRLWPAALLSAALFGIAHVDAGSFPVLFVIGIALAWARWRFGSLLPGIAIHACNNLLAAALIVVAMAH
jgi:membrane protease YdiL (CAAX protease family)